MNPIERNLEYSNVELIKFNPISIITKIEKFSHPTN